MRSHLPLLGYFFRPLFSTSNLASTATLNCLFLIALLSVRAPARAATTVYTWNDSTSSWTTPSAWSPAGPDWSDPQRLVDTQVSFGINDTTTYQPTLDNNVSVGYVNIYNGKAPWTISSSFGVLNVGFGGIQVNGPVQNNTIISAPVNITTAQTWQISQGEILNITGPLSGSSDLTKTGYGELKLSGKNTYSGTIDATEGTLQVAGITALANIYGLGGRVQLADGAVVGGDLNIGNDTGFQASSSGTAATQTNSPQFFGDSEEATVMGTLTFGQDALIEFDVQGTVPESGYDQVEVDKDVVISGADLDLMLDGYTPSLGETYFLINNHGADPISGAFDNAPEGSVIYADGYAFLATYLADADSGSLTGGNDMALTAVVPEPCTALLIGLPLLAVGRPARKQIPPPIA